MTDTTDPTRWEQYYRAVQGRAPRPLFLAAIAAFEAAGGVPAGGAQAVDLGCGDGIETLTLVKDGWRVLAIDQQPEAIARVLAATPADAQGRLQTQLAAFQEVALPPADFVYAGLSLPFCPPAHFPVVWRRIVAALRPGGRVAVHLFGERDGWRDDPAMTFHTAAEVRLLLGDLEIETLIEVEDDRPTALGEPKHWHVFEVVARRAAQRCASAADRPSSG